jgi:hypothetical protein
MKLEHCNCPAGSGWPRPVTPTLRSGWRCGAGRPWARNHRPRQRPPCFGRAARHSSCSAPVRQTVRWPCRSTAPRPARWPPRRSGSSSTVRHRSTSTWAAPSTR